MHIVALEGDSLLPRGILWKWHCVAVVGMGAEGPARLSVEHRPLIHTLRAVAYTVRNPGSGEDRYGSPL